MRTDELLEPFDGMNRVGQARIDHHPSTTNEEAHSSRSMLYKGWM